MNTKSGDFGYSVVDPKSGDFSYSAPLVPLGCIRMWCPHCQSDVPQTAQAATGSRRCCRCGRSADATPRRAGSDEGLDLGSAPRTGRTSVAQLGWDDWTLAAEVHRARLLLSNATAGGSAAGWRLDGRHLRLVDPARESDTRREVDHPSRPRPIGRNSRRLASSAALACGVAIFCCGALVAASLVDVSAAVARLGVPLMLMGLFGLAIGVLSQLHRIRRETRAALDRMRLVDLRLQEYRQAALLVGPAAPVGGTDKLSGLSVASRYEHYLTGARLDDPRFRGFELFAAKDF